MKLTTLSAALLIGLLSFAQQPQTPHPAPPLRQPVTPGAKADESKGQVKITAKQAKQLFASIDGVLEFVSADTKLPIKHPVAKKLAGREQVQGYIQRKMSDGQDTKRFEQSEVVLKKFGLLPRDFELKPFLVALLRDQVAGFYDVKTKTVYLLDWVDPELQKPVMAHELTHALQDQNFDLEKMGKDTRRDDAEKRGDVDRTIELDENSTAQSAMIEGQGMITFADYALRQYGRSAQDSPAAIAAMIDSMGADNPSQIMTGAPMLLRESLTFPYRDGMRFVEAVLLKKGKQGAFAGMFARPPSTSFEVMTPSAYLAAKPLPRVRLPDMKILLGSNYGPYDLGAMGEFDVQLLLKQFSAPADVNDLTLRWNGGAYYAALRKGEPAGRTASIAMLYVSHWTDAEAAQDFARIYADSLATKYKKLQAAECSPCEAGERRWTSEEGFVEVDQRGSKVIVSEGFEQPIALQLRDAVLSGGGQELSAAAGELAVRAVPGWMRAMFAAAMPGK